jgi:uncharacterized protein (TIGR02466 family)
VLDRPSAAKPVAALVREMYFPTPIFYSDIPDAFALNEAIRPHIYAWRDHDPAGIVRSNVKRLGSWHSTDDMNRRPEYEALANSILAAGSIVFEQFGYDPAFAVAFDNMWANINPRYGLNRSHIHPNVLWSGVYYVQAPADCGRILFTDPRAQAAILTPRYAPGPRKPEVWSEVYFEAVAGRLILFPAWLVHEVEPNMAEAEGPAGDRISISFNLVQRSRGKL